MPCAVAQVVINPSIRVRTDEEKLHVRRGTIDSLESHMKMRFVAPGDWIRIKFDLQHLCTPGGRQGNSCIWSTFDP